MTTITWDNVGEKIYESGVSKGVLYTEDGVGYPWNGLTSVDVSEDTQVEPVHYDGRKINDIVTVGDFSGTIRAFTYPEEFLPYEGVSEDHSGVYLTGQLSKQFGMSYQTLIGNDVSGSSFAYKIHLLYNLTAIPQTRSHKSLGLNVEPMEFEWSITGVPEDIDRHRPTVHVIFDSRKIPTILMADIEGLLYGDETKEASLPSLKALTSFIRRWERLIINEYGDGTWSAESEVPGMITMLDSETFQIDTPTATYLDADTYTIESSDEEEV